MRLLLAEDDDLFGLALHKSLVRAGYAVDWAKTGSDALLATSTHKYDGALLDLGLPDMPGKALLESIRLRDLRMSIVVISASGGAHDRIHLLDIGADDYMVKPVDLDEVRARLRALARRVAAPQECDEALEHGALKLIPARQQALWQDEQVNLTRKEFWLLETFVRKKNQILTRSQLEDSLYGWGEEIGSNTVEVYICYLRRKFNPTLIETVRGVGYQLGSMRTFSQRAA
jgi:DNA-binding response OmpR family regulator